MYRLGFIPWDGHPLATSLRALIEGNDALAWKKGKALDIGCGTGDSAIYLAKRGWDVTGVDFVATALDKARAKASAEKVAVSFAQADVTQLGSTGVGGGFGLIVDNGCLHGMTDEHRDGYVREVTAAAGPDARLLLIAFKPGGSRGVRGIEQAEIERRFTLGWTLLAAGDETAIDYNGNNPRHYLLQRRTS